MDIPARIFYRDRRENLESMVDTGKREALGRALKYTRKHTSSMLRMFFKRSEVNTMLACFAAGSL